MSVRVRWVVAVVGVAILATVLPGIALVVAAVMVAVIVVRAITAPVSEHESIRRIREMTWAQPTVPIQYPPPPSPQSVSRRRRYIAAETRLAVFKRDGEQCVVCGSRNDLTVDHIVAVSRGGSDDMANLNTMCSECNNRKGAKLSMPDWKD